MAASQRSDELPSDVASLQAMVRAMQEAASSSLARAASAEQRVAVLEASNARLEQGNVHLQAWIEKLKLQIARLQRMQFGQSSEKLDGQIAQLELIVEELEATQAEVAPQTLYWAPAKPTVRKPLPDHLPREIVLHEPACVCPDCGSAMTRIGEDVAEMIERVPATLKVIRHVRPKLACNRCDRIAQMPAPARPIERSPAGPGLLAHIAISKFADALPLYRQSQIYTRDGIELERSTLADWLGGTARLVRPLVDAIGRYVVSATKLHADDTPVPVLQPGRGSTKTGRLWTYVRDDQASGSSEAPAVWFQYSPDRKGERPGRHLATFRGTLQADAYAGFERLYQRGDIAEAACWAHARRNFYEIHKSSGSPIAAEALARIGQLYGIESDARGKTRSQRQAIRQARAGPLLQALHEWLSATLTQVSNKSDLAKALRYPLTRWKAMTRYRDDGAVEIDNNIAERALRAVAVGRKNWLFAGSDDGGERAAAFYTLIGTAKLNELNPETYLRHVLERIATHPINRIEDLMPWNVAAHLQPSLSDAA